MQDVDIVSEHLYNSFMLGTMTIANKRLDMSVEFENKWEEANERVCTSVFNYSPGETMDRIQFISAQHRHNWKHERVGTRSVVDVHMKDVQAFCLQNKFTKNASKKTFCSVRWITLDQIEDVETASRRALDCSAFISARTPRRTFWKKRLCYTWHGIRSSWKH